ncbi:7TM GPCR, serpentine receptor class x (Srx) family-containing protein [Strongyloides ratti]|uniref:7TM GPCR, serpentine receptor class x (Srx) family-containing protein n=1 Tax=Strongyloides ratti TaxID=34506 RepID=A0A090LBQ8_STRRB|nr:7TM GPCR, serpentine receptor class x (Srx) family-containing protein [Strongyloides ratti]CEF64975.1 7TM GPCR, serpentine receptor class x (Srx) family-containing protein [Strongyloides ratti]
MDYFENYSYFENLTYENDGNFNDYILPFPLTFILTHVEIGIIHFLLSSFFMVLQLLVFLSFFNNKELFTKTSFIIIFNHGILSFIQQICHVITAILTIFFIKKISRLLSIIGSLLTASYIGSIIFIFLLTLNRFDILYDIQLINFERKEIIYIIFIIICYLCTITLFIVYIVFPEFMLVFNYNLFEWQYENRLESRTVYQFEKYSILSLLGVSLILQILIFFKVIFLRCSTNRKIVFVADDLKIILHAFLCFVTALILELIRDGIFFYIYWSGNQIIIPHILRIFCSVSNSFFVLCFVKEIRNYIFISKHVKTDFRNTTIVKSIKVSGNINNIRNIA